MRNLSFLIDYTRVQQKFLSYIEISRTYGPLHQKIFYAEVDARVFSLILPITTTAIDYQSIIN